MGIAQYLSDVFKMEADVSAVEQAVENIVTRAVENNRWAEQGEDSDSG